jgi:nicotinamidase/pyrazinamidase
MTVRKGAALVVVDVQNDFVSGSLAVPDAEAIFDPINAAKENFEYVVYTRDFHPPNHFSFSDEPEYVDGSWPSHCVEGEHGSELDERILLPSESDIVLFSKGTDAGVEAYSGFDGSTDDGESLDDWLSERNVNRVAVVGLATDYCVKATALSAVSFGYETTVLAEGVRGVHPVTTLVAAGQMADEDVFIETLDNALGISL